MDSETYYNYGTQKDGSFMVAGGGLGNGNAYAQVELENDKYYYREYGKNPFRKYIGDEIVWLEDGNFRIFERDELIEKMKNILRTVPPRCLLSKDPRMINSRMIYKQSEEEEEEEEVSYPRYEVLEYDDEEESFDTETFDTENAAQKYFDSLGLIKKELLKVFEPDTLDDITLDYYDPDE